MILAVLDDLMFSSKLRAAAAAGGATLRFARTREAALTAVRDERPALVLLDLDNPRTDPLGLLTAWRHETATSTLPVIGFVSHVRVDLIDAARAAGITEVLARSGFVQRLPLLMARDTSGSPSGTDSSATEPAAASADEEPPRQ